MIFNANVPYIINPLKLKRFDEFPVKVIRSTPYYLINVDIGAPWVVWEFSAIDYLIIIHH